MPKRDELVKDLETRAAQTDSEQPLDPAVMVKLVDGDLSGLTDKQKVQYYYAVCKSVNLNPLTQPLMFMRQRDGKIGLYAKRDAADQLRKRDKISTAIVDRSLKDGVYTVVARVSTPSGRCEESTGVVFLKDLSGEALANAMMKAESKAKRRATLSISGLGMPDETEFETIPGAESVALPDLEVAKVDQGQPDEAATPEIVIDETIIEETAPPPEEPIDEKISRRIELSRDIKLKLTELDWVKGDMDHYLGEHYEGRPRADLTDDELAAIAKHLSSMIERRDGAASEQKEA